MRWVLLLLASQSVTSTNDSCASLTLRKHDYIGALGHLDTPWIHLTHHELVCSIPFKAWLKIPLLLFKAAVSARVCSGDAGCAVPDADDATGLLQRTTLGPKLVSTAEDP